MRTTAELDTAVRAGSRSRHVRFFSLDTNRQPLEAIEGSIECAINADMTRAARRSGSMRIANLDRRYRLEPESLFAYSWVRVERGLELANGSVEYTPLITAVASEPLLDGALLTVELGDLSVNIARTEFEEPVTFPRGMDVGDYIRALLILGGLPDDDAWYDFEDFGREIRIDYSHDPPDHPWDAALDAARDYGLRLYFDALGTVRLRTVPVLADATPVWSFAPGEDSPGRIVSKGLSLANVKNRGVARGVSSGRPIVQTETRNMNPDSEFYNPPPDHPDYPGLRGDRPIRIQSAAIVDEDQAQEVSRVLLQDHSFADETIEINAAAHPGLDEEDVIEARRDELGVNARYLIHSFSLTTNTLAERITAKRLQSLG